MGLAGALFAHKIAYLAPDIFTILLSIQFLLLVIVGGLGSLHGAVFGAIFVALLPPLIAILRDSIPDSMADFAAAHRHRADRQPRQRDRRLPEEARRRGRHLRPDPGAGDPARAARHVRPLAQDQALLLDLPDVQGVDLQAAEELHAVGAAAMSLFSGREPLDQLRRHQGRRRRQLRRRRRARSSPSSAPTAPARPRSSTW